MKIIDCFIDNRGSCNFLIEESSNSLYIIEAVWLTAYNIDYIRDEVERGGIWSPIQKYYMGQRKKIDLTMTAGDYRHVATNYSEWLNLKERESVKLP